jgi:preprotein translocase subunit SecA
MLGFFKKIFGTKHQRDVKHLMFLVRQINAMEQEYQALSEEQLIAKTQEFKERLRKGQTLDDIMCEAFAVVKNACRRRMGSSVEVCGQNLVWDMIPFDVQICGAIVLHRGKIAEMATGEGKTLVATMPLYLNALSGKSVHLITVNDYLARRDSQWMGHVLTYLGLSVGCIQNQMTFEERHVEYAKDITYGTNSEFGFDYLRDNGMAYTPEGQVQRGHFFAIVDEVDSILIDEARTPLIISGPVPYSSNQYRELRPKVEDLVHRQRMLCNRIAQEAKELLEKQKIEEAKPKLYQLKQGMPKHTQLMHMMEEPATRRILEQVDNSMLVDMNKEQARALREEMFFIIDERGHEVGLTEKGCEALNPSDPDAYILPDMVTVITDLEADTNMPEEEKLKKKQEIQQLFADRSERIHNVDQLIRAFCLYEKDVEYVVQDNQVLIVDEYTGRILPGRRWSDGLHQAVEAKEGVTIEKETQTLATITIQNYFRLYEKLAGMTGTAETEAMEFLQIYKLDVVVIPTNRPVRRVDTNDVIYKTQREKYKALIEQIIQCHKNGQPVLVGTISVEASELLSRLLKRENIPHTVLNAKNHEREADIVRGAGHAGAVTIATNMAGRGTDIKLGEGVVWIDRQMILSGTSLNDRMGDKTMRDALLEKPCGLFVIGTERHESRRIDRQLRGRCARQGDPGMSRFYVSLEDDLMRLFGSDRIAGIMTRLGLEEGQELEHRWLNRSIENAQRRVEEHNFSIRKRTLQYDDVMNKQRGAIYGFRGAVVKAEKVREQIYDVLYDVIADRVELLKEDRSDERLKELQEWVQTTFPVPARVTEMSEHRDDTEALTRFLFDRVQKAYDLKVQFESPDSINMMERQIILGQIDMRWQEYLRAMDDLRQGVHLRAYGQRDPLVEYKKEAFIMFEELMGAIKLDIAQAVFRSTTSAQSFESFLAALPKQMVHDEVSLLGHGAAAGRRQLSGAGGEESMGAVSSSATGAGPVRRDHSKVGRNDACPCGSGKKFKKCCGK